MRRRRPGATMAVLVALATGILAGCGGSGEPAPRPSALALLPTRGLQLVRAGIPGPLPSSVPIAGAMMASFEVLDGDPAYERALEIRLSSGESSEPIDDAAVSVHAEMVLMDHDPFDAVATGAGDGTYRVTLPFTMAGEWQLELVITTPEATGSVGLALDVFD